MESNISGEVYFIDGCAIEDDFVYVATGLEDVDPDEYAHSRLCVYDAQSTEAIKWFYHDLDANIVSVCVKKKSPTSSRSLCSLSKEGEVEFYDNGSGTGACEKIAGAGARLGTGGYLTQIREIGSTLFACGQHGQVYKRADSGWIHCDKSLFNVPLDFDPDAIMLNSIDGFSENDLYVAGDDGKIFHYNGKDWRQIVTGIDEHLTWIRAYGSDEVWACGNNGALLKGNAKTGFADLSGVDDNLTFESLVKLNDCVYLSTLNNGIFLFDGNRIAPVNSGLTPPLQSYRLDCAGKVMWSFGIKDVACFDGKTWTRMDYPDNPAI